MNDGLHEIDLDVDPDLALEAVEVAAQAWGGDFERRGSGARIEVPLAAGVRRGWLDGSVVVQTEGSGSRVAIHTEQLEYRVHTASAFILAVGALAGLVTIVTPFVPSLLPLLPVSAILLVVTWLLVVARLRHRNLDDFLAAVREISAT